MVHLSVEPTCFTADFLASFSCCRGPRLVYSSRCCSSGARYSAEASSLGFRVAFGVR